MNAKSFFRRLLPENYRLRQREGKLRAAHERYRERAKAGEDLEHEVRDSWHDLLDFQDQCLVDKAKSWGIHLDQLDLEGGDAVSPHLAGPGYSYGETGQWLLTDEARTALHRAMRDREPEIKRDQRDRVRTWTMVISTLIAAITGLIGTVIGLLAFLREP